MTLGLPPDRARGGHDPLIRRNRHILQERPLPSMRWADIPQLSTRDQRCPAAWQQYWQQSLPKRTDPPPAAFQVCQSATCDGPIPAKAGPDAVSCSVRCRQARHRFLHAVGYADSVAPCRPFRLA